MTPHMGRVTKWLAGPALVVAMVASIGSMTPAGAQDTPEQVVIELEEVNGSGVTGVATLTAVDGATEVMLQLQGQLNGNVVHVHSGTCADYDPDPLAAAADLVLNPTDPEGGSTTTIDIPLDEWLATETIIHVHAGEREIDDVLVCGDVVADLGGADADGVEDVNGGPDVGVGTSVLDDSSRGGLLAALGAVAAVLAVAGAFARRGGRAMSGGV